MNGEVKVPLKIFHVVEFPPGEIEPLFVAARDVPKVIIGISKSTLGNWRCAKKGPAYHMVNGTPYYNWQELKDYFSTGRVETFNGRDL